MTIGDLIKHIAATGHALQKANPDMAIETFHAIPVVMQLEEHSAVLGSVRVMTAAGGAISLLLSYQTPGEKK